jgi:hypothetical protein
MLSPGGSPLSNSIAVVELKSESTGIVGYGRDPDEAAAHSGYSGEPDDSELGEVEVSDSPPTGDIASEAVANAIRRFHVEDDEELSKAVRDRLRKLPSEIQFATAVAYCFETVWDRGYELDLPPSERKYLP